MAEVSAIKILRPPKTDTPIQFVNSKICRICLSSNKSMQPLFKSNYAGNYAEMLTSVADVKIAASDGLPDKICIKCSNALEKAHLIKILAERSDRKLRKLLSQQIKQKPTKLSFNSLDDIKTKIAPLTKIPKKDTEVQIISPNTHLETIDMTNCTVIKKLESKINVDRKEEETVDVEDLGNNDLMQGEYIDDDIFLVDDDNKNNCDNGDNCDDEDYVPPSEPKLNKINVLKENKEPLNMRKIKVMRYCNTDIKVSKKNTEIVKSGGFITCYPITKNGKRGTPILLKKPTNTKIKNFGSYFKKEVEQSNKESKKEVCEKNVKKEKEKFVCSVCGIQTYTIKSHMMTHEEKKKYQCEECPKTFSQNDTLIAHMKRHSGVKDYICSICGSAYYSQKGLIRHNLVHKGERPHQCDMCNKKFIAKCDLNRHLRIHAGYKPFKCTNCSMSFNAKHQLQNHQRMHTGERPYTCKICDVAFAYKVNLNKHVFKIHGVNIKFKPIHTFTEEVLNQESEFVNETKNAVAHIPELMETPEVAENTIVITQNSDHDSYSMSN